MLKIIHNSTFKAFLMLILIGGISFASFSCNQNGCTDPAASNYDPDAQADDNSCEYQASVVFNVFLQFGCQGMVFFVNDDFKGNLSGTTVTSDVDPQTFRVDLSAGTWTYAVNDSCQSWTGTFELGAGDLETITLSR